ncbi:MAG: hypothetical protein WBG46_09980 [Nonlabens sp.]
MKRLHHLLENPREVHIEDLRELSRLVSEYPYFQAARSLYLKCLKESNSPIYNKELQTTAAHTTDRSVLFDFITSHEFSQNNTSESIKNHQNQTFNIEVDEEEVKVQSNDLNKDGDFDKVTDPQLFEKRKDISEEPLEFDKNEAYSFNEWLKLTSLQTLEKKDEKSTSEKNDKTDLNNELRKRKMQRIDRFLAEKPKIKPSKEKVNLKDLEINTSPSTPLMTETLARVYLAQKNYEKAIKSYQILVLQHPEKSSFFANQIQEIKNLQSKT